MIGYITWPVNTEYRFFGFPVFPHGVLILVGALLGGLLSRRYARREGLPDDLYWAVFEWIAIGGLIGQRLFWVLGNWSQLSSPLEALMIWHGGMTLFGGIAGAVVAGRWRARRSGVPVLAMSDVAAPGFALALLIGRISDLIVGDHLGKPTSLPWGFKYLGDDPAGMAPRVGSIVHPVALYDAINVGILLVVLVLFLRKPRAPGSAAALFVLWYGSSRILTDLLRTDPVRAFGLTGTQLASIAAVTVTTVWLVLREQRGWVYPHFAEQRL